MDFTGTAVRQTAATSSETECVALGGRVLNRTGVLWSFFCYTNEPYLLLTWPL